MKRTVILLMLAFEVAPLIHGASAFAASSEVQQLKEEIRRLREENERNRKRTEELERKVQQIEANEAQKTKEVEKQVATEVEKQTAAAPRRYMERYLGENRFVLTGWGSAAYEWKRNGNTNSFVATLAPILLYRVTDRVLFEAEPEFELQDDGSTELNLEYAQADVFLNDYATLVAGKFLLPFGEFIQQLHPGWINKLVSFPLPYEEDAGLLPFSDVGVQLRGGLRLADQEGLNLEYTAFVSNGPRFESNAVGAPFEADNVDVNTGKGFGGHLALLYQAADSRFGNVKLGASSYDGTWNESNGLWFWSWGMDAAYRLDELELRGEYLRTRREMPQGVTTDRRDGWYIQAAYKLARLPVPHVNRMELVTRFSRRDQRASTDEEILPHPREFAFGLDYWLTPSVVGKLEYDRELPKNAPSDDVIRGQLAVGF